MCLKVFAEQNFGINSNFNVIYDMLSLQIYISLYVSNTLDSKSIKKMSEISQKHMLPYYGYTLKIPKGFMH